MTKENEAAGPPYVPPRFKLTSALDARRDYTIEQEISFFFIGWAHHFIAAADVEEAAICVESF